MQETPEYSQDFIVGESRAKYILGEITRMIAEHHHGIHRPWSDRKHQVEEEFS